MRERQRVWLTYRGKMSFRYSKNAVPILFFSFLFVSALLGFILLRFSSSSSQLCVKIFNSSFFVLSIRNYFRSRYPFTSIHQFSSFPFVIDDLSFAFWLFLCVSVCAKKSGDVTELQIGVKVNSNLLLWLRSMPYL